MAQPVWSLDPAVPQEWLLGITGLCGHEIQLSSRSSLWASRVCVVVRPSGPPGVASGHHGSVWPLDPVVLQEQPLGIAGLCGRKIQRSFRSRLWASQVCVVLRPSGPPGAASGHLEPCGPYIQWSSRSRLWASWVCVALRPSGPPGAGSRHRRSVWS